MEDRSDRQALVYKSADTSFPPGDSLLFPRQQAPPPCTVEFSGRYHLQCRVGFALLIEFNLIAELKNERHAAIK